MKPKRQEAQKNRARNGAASADPNAGDPQDLREMWSAVAALLDDTTEDTGTTRAASPQMPQMPPRAPAASSAPPSAETTPSAPEPAPVRDTGSPSVGKRVNDLFSPFWKQPQTQPKPSAESSRESHTDAPADPHTEPHREPADTPSDNWNQAPVEQPAPNGDSEGTPHTRNGKPLTPPYAPGAGPQILPEPDAWLQTPPAGDYPASDYPSNQPPAFAQPSPLPRTSGEPFILPEGLDNHSVTIRGRNDGVGIEMGEGKWDDLLYMLAWRVEQTDGFFRGGTIAVDVGNRHVAEPELHQLRSILGAYGMDPSLLRTTSERTFQAALAVGIPCTQIGADGAPVNEALLAGTDESGAGFFIYRGSLRSGQVLYRRENIIVIGDVNPGAEVVSDGDVMVWGRMRGIAHAGARGNQHAVITALDMDPVQIRIDTIIGAAQAGISSNGPRWGAGRSAERRAEIARLINGKLTIQNWDEAKTGGIALLKRRFF